MDAGEGGKSVFTSVHPCPRNVAIRSDRSVIVAAVAVELAANFAARPSGAVNVRVSCTDTNSRDQFVKFSGADSPLVSKVGDVRCRDGAGYRRWWRGTRLSSRRAVAEIGAKEHADGPGYTFLSEVDMSLLNGSFEVGVTKLPVDARFVIADTRAECAVTGG